MLKLELNGGGGPELWCELSPWPPDVVMAAGSCWSCSCDEALLVVAEGSHGPGGQERELEIWYCPPPPPDRSVSACVTAGLWLCEDDVVVAAWVWSTLKWFSLKDFVVLLSCPNNLTLTTWFNFPNGHLVSISGSNSRDSWMLFNFSSRHVSLSSIMSWRLFTSDTISYTEFWVWNEIFFS